MFPPYSLLQNLLNVETNCDTSSCCLVGGDVLDAPPSMGIISPLYTANMI